MARGHLDYDQLISQIKAQPMSQKEYQAFLLGAKKCDETCTCQIYDDLNGLFRPKDGGILKKVKDHSRSMTDGQYRSCQEKRRLDCKSKSVKSLLRSLKQEDESSS